MKYGWEICDEVQRHVGDTADAQYVSAKYHDQVVAERDDLKSRCHDLESRCERSVALLVTIRQRMIWLSADSMKYTGTDAGNMASGTIKDIDAALAGEPVAGEGEK